MASLADLNRQRRDFAFSGRAGTSDIPYLYELAAARRAQAEGGLGDGDVSGLQDAGAAPNPLTLGSLASGGGASGAADAGLPGPGLTGQGEEFDVAFKAYLDARGGDRGFGGDSSFDRGFGDLPEGNIDDIPGGWSGLLGLAGGMFPIPGFGTAGRVIGGGIDIARGYQEAEDFDPTGGGGVGGFLEAVGAELTGGRFGLRDAFEQRRDQYRDRTGTALGDEALAAARDAKRGRGTYSGPKGVVGNRVDGNRGADRGSRSRGSDIDRAREGGRRGRGGVATA